MELEALQEIYGQVQEAGGSLVSVSPQLAKYTKQVVKKNNLTFPVLADKDDGYSRQLGLTFKLSERLKETYLSFGIDLVRFNGNESWELPMSGRFLVGSDGIIKSTDVHPDHTIRPEPAEIVDFMKSLK